MLAGATRSTQPQVIPATIAPRGGPTRARAARPVGVRARKNGLASGVARGRAPVGRTEPPVESEGIRHPRCAAAVVGPMGFYGLDPPFAA